jgi:hypothetical protein
MPIFLLLLALIIGPQPASAATVAELTAAQQRLTTYLQGEITKSETGDIELRAMMKAGKPIEYAMDPRELLKIGEEQRRSVKQLLKKVSAAQPAALPSSLAALLTSCKQSKCEGGIDQSFLEDALIAYGPLVWPPLEAAWPGLDEYAQESVVYLSGRFAPSECRQSWLDTALQSSVHRVAFAALQVFKSTCDMGAFWPRLDARLEREKNPELLLALLDLVPDTVPQSTTYRRRLLELTETGRIPLAQAFPKICTEPAPKLDLVLRPINASFWLKAYQENPARQMCLVEALFVQLNNPQTLAELTPLLSDAASHLYGFTATTDLAGSFTTAPHLTQWDSRPGLDIALLSAFRQNLTPQTITTWFNQPGMALSDKMVLGYWLGQDPRSLLPAQLPLSITVTNAAGQIVSAHTAPLTLNTLFDFTVPATGDFPAINYQGTLQFNGEALHYRIGTLLVGLKPAAAGFAVTLPLLGKFETDLNMGGQTYRWTLAIKSDARP